MNLTLVLAGWLVYNTGFAAVVTYRCLQPGLVGCGRVLPRAASADLAIGPRERWGMRERRAREHAGSAGTSRAPVDCLR